MFARFGSNAPDGDIAENVPNIRHVRFGLDAARDGGGEGVGGGHMHIFSCPPDPVKAVRQNVTKA